jgi:hypothetical protein
MALSSGGSISMGQIATETQVALSGVSLWNSSRRMSGSNPYGYYPASMTSTPDSMSEFRGTAFANQTQASCLLEGTLISMADGTTKKIEDLIVGDALKGISIEGLPLDETVHFAWTSENPSITTTDTIVVNATKIEAFAIYNINKGLLKATAEHIHLVKREAIYMFVQSSELLVGDIVLDSQLNEVVITSVENERMEDDHSVNVYLIDVETIDLFIANNIITHNKKPMQ